MSTMPRKRPRFAMLHLRLAPGPHGEVIVRVPYQGGVGHRLTLWLETGRALELDFRPAADEDYARERVEMFLADARTK